MTFFLNIKLEVTLKIAGVNFMRGQQLQAYIFEIFKNYHIITRTKHFKTVKESDFNILN